MKTILQVVSEYCVFPPDCDNIVEVSEDERNGSPGNEANYYLDLIDTPSYQVRY